MRPSPKHQYTTILYADIVGYTSLMQSNEQEALMKLQNFKLILETKVPSYKGEIIQFYGDGCLTIFENTKNALLCAQALQIAFQDHPTVPVRIGLHEGEVVFKDKNVFGPTVNIASRVESMGVAGAILMTGNVRQFVKKEAAFQLAFLGKHQLKNVADPLSIYALANKGFPVPKLSDLTNVTDQNQSTRKKNSFLYWLIPSLIAGVLGLLLWQSLSTETKIDTQILKERIAVLPFKNKTNDPKLDVLGDMAADWINTGLMEIGGAEVVSPFTVRTHKEAVGILENDPQNRPSFAQLTGAKNLITGNFYKDKSDIIFKLELVDALDGQLRFSFKEIRGDEEDKEILINKLNESVLGYWAARSMVDANKMKAPKFEAYELYLTSLNKAYSQEIYKKTLAIDSTFYLVRINYLNQNKAGSHGENNSHFAFLERHLSNLSDYEKAWFQYLKGIYLGKIEMAFNSLNTIRVKYPKDFVLNHVTATTALDCLNNPALALAIYEELPMKESDGSNFALYYNHRVNNTIIGLIQQKKVQEAVNYLKSVSIKPIGTVQMNHYLRTVLFDALLSQNEAKIKAAYQQFTTSFKDNPFSYFLLAFTIDQSNILPKDLRQKLNKDIIAFYQQLDPTNFNRMLWRNIVGRMANKPEMIQIDDLDKLPTSMRISSLAAAGFFYHQTHQLTLLQEVIQKLQQLTTPNYSAHSQVGAAFAHYFIGRLQTLLGNYDVALNHLKKARYLGAETRLIYFQYDRHLTPLYDRPEFQELLQPIWPASDQAKVAVLAVNQYKEAVGRLENETANFHQNQQLQLASGDRFFTLKLGTTNHFNTQKVVYHYQVKDVDKEWSVAQSNELTISGLPYGQQTIQIKALFPNGRFTKDILEIPVYVAKPFYLTLGFLLSMLAILGLSIFLWSQRLKKQKLALEEEVRRRTAKIEKQAAELKQLDKVKSNFFANVSHELRTPLTLILSPLQKVLEEETLSNKGKKLLKTIEQNGQNLHKLVNEIMDLTKLEAGKLNLQETPTVLYPLMQRLVGSFESYAEKKEIQLSLDYQAHKHLQIELDKNKFEKIVNNLLSNALKFTPKSGRIIVLVEDVGYAIQLEVSDTGQGIHPEDLPHIFNRFYQSKQVGATTDGGTGIGLALVQEFAKLFGGSVVAKSKLNQGSQFIFNFPKKQVLQALGEEEIVAIANLEQTYLDRSITSKTRLAVEAIQAIDIPQDKTRSTNAPKFTILIVEDNLQLREYIELILGEQYQVLTAAHGQEALDILLKTDQENPIELIVSDLMMPVLDGLQLLTQLRATDAFRSIPFVLLTARADLEDKLTALRIGVDDYMLKPFIEEELLARVANLLHNAQARQQFVQVEKESSLLAATNNQKAISETKSDNTISASDLAWLAELEQQVLTSLSEFDFTLERLGQQIYLSPRQIRRRLKQLTGLSFSQYLREARFRKARQLLELQKVHTIKQLAYEVGMRDVKYFSQQFKQHFGKNPSAYLN